MENTEQIYRQKSLDRISSPEQMHDYMRVTSPQLWMILAVIISLLAGLIIFSATTKMESAITVKGTVTGKTCVLQLDASQRNNLDPGMSVRIDGKEAVITSFYLDRNGLTGNVELGDLDIAEGEYDVEIVTESTNPIDFLLHR